MADLDLGEIPLPAEPVRTGAVKDDFNYGVGFNFAFVGVGQGGGRIAEAYYKLGYRRVLIINTAVQDLAEIAVPDANKLDIGGGGAGKDPDVGAAAAAAKAEEIFDGLRRTCGEDTDYLFVCFGAGGGTGAGCSPKIIQIAKTFLAPQGRQGRVGTIMAIPKVTEGQKPARNALRTIRKIGELGGISPIILIDNDKIRDLYDPTPAQEYPLSNRTVAHYLHLFNRLAAQDTDHTSFDRADLATLLDGGLAVFSAKRIPKWDQPSDISAAVRDQLEKTVLAPVDLAKGRRAGLLFVCGRPVYEGIKSSTLDYGFDMLNRTLADGAVVFRGIYPGDGNDLTSLIMISDLQWPKERLQALARTARLDPQEQTDWLGI